VKTRDARSMNASDILDILPAVLTEYL